MANIYCAMAIHVENGQASQPAVKYYDDRNQAERQYCLYRAAAATSNYPQDTAILMLVDGAVLESKTYTHTATPVEASE